MTAPMSEHDRESPLGSAGSPPEAWQRAHRLVRRAREPIERFLAIEAASGLLLLATAGLALVLANGPWRHAYEALWHTPLGFRLGTLHFEQDLHFWINDGLMTIFFFVVGLEIRREIHRGELSGLRRAALPVAAALGGMLFPAVLYALFNRGRPSLAGWGIPMATDIAFAVGTLALLGKRVPPALRVLLLALAVIDDVGAILVIAVFYSTGLSWLGFLAMGLGTLAIYGLQKLGVRPALAYLLPGLVIWAGAYEAGVHPTLAGVIVGLMTPVRAWFGPQRFAQHAQQGAARLGSLDAAEERAALGILDELAQARREAVSPVERLEHALHGYVAFGIMPLFAFANAGVPLGEASFTGDHRAVFLGIVVGLSLGKPLGIVAFSWLLVKLGLGALPMGLSLRHVVLVGLVGGIGFTMALFIAQLALPPGALLETAKLAILVASGLAALLSSLLGLWLLPRRAGRSRDLPVKTRPEASTS
ncbi:MAG: Na+/H+ antiporter NhaA [Myxococcales bacterium]